MIHQIEITLAARSRGFHIITSEVLTALGDMPSQGMLSIFIKHTSAGLTVNENDDPDVRADYESIFNMMVPENLPFLKHTVEGPDDMPAHIKASLVGSSVTIPITNGKLNLGTWQGIFLCEFRNRATPRKLVLTIYS